VIPGGKGEPGKPAWEPQMKLSANIRGPEVKLPEQPPCKEAFVLKIEGAFA